MKKDAVISVPNAERLSKTERKHFVFDVGKLSVVLAPYFRDLIVFQDIQDTFAEDNGCVESIDTAKKGNKVNYCQNSIMQVKDGKVQEWWLLEDNLGTMMELGMELKPKEAEKK